MKKRVVAIDYGLKRIGVAISDESQLIARSLGIVEAHYHIDETIKRILKVLTPFEFEKIIVGYPLHLDGKTSLLSEEVSRFIEQLQKSFNCPILKWDERLSSVQAERSLMEGGMNRKKRVKVLDAVTAMILLQSYLGY